MTCKCIDKVNEKLAQRNTRLALTITLNQSLSAYPSIATEQIETGRGKPKAIGMIPSYCPFCGASYQREG